MREPSSRRSDTRTIMLCHTCVGILENGRNLIEGKFHRAWSDSSDTDTSQLSREGESAYVQDVNGSCGEGDQSDFNAAEVLSTAPNERTNNACQSAVPKAYGDCVSTNGAPDERRFETKNGLRSSCNDVSIECRVLRLNDTRYGHHRTLLSLQETVKSNCLVCSRAWNHLSEAQRRTLGDFEASRFEDSPGASHKSLDVAARWLRDCISSHAICARETPAIPWYPTRLLDLERIWPQIHRDSFDTRSRP